MKKGILLLWLGLLCLAGTLGLAEEISAAAGPMPQAKYAGIAQSNLVIRVEPSYDAASVGQLFIDEKTYVVDYLPGWLYVVKGDADSWVAGYVPRHRVYSVKTIEEGADIPLYGSTPSAYTATIARDTPLYLSPGDEEHVFLLTKGMRVAILQIDDGWAQVVYLREYTYFYLDDVEDLTPVYDADSAQSGDSLGAFISFYTTVTTGLNPNRMVNIALACERISNEMEPGFAFSFNSIGGPYQGKYGYLEAPSFVDGLTVPSFGGGTCQVSSTLYNVLLPLNDGITVTYRRAHGPGGAAYLPHGVDAAVGNETIDLCFRNDYPFSVRIDASCQDGVLFIALKKA